MLWCCECGSYAIDFTPERWEVVATFCVGTNSRQRFLRYPNFHHKLNFYEWTFSRAQFDSYECGQCCRHEVCQRGSPFRAIPWLARNTISCLIFDGTVRTFRFDTAASSEWLKHPPNFEHISHMIWLKGKRAPCDGADLERLPCHGNLSSPLSLVRASFHPSAWEAEVQNLRR